MSGKNVHAWAVRLWCELVLLDHARSSRREPGVTLKSSSISSSRLMYRLCRTERTRTDVTSVPPKGVLPAQCSPLNPAVDSRFPLRLLVSESRCQTSTVTLFGFLHPGPNGTRPIFTQLHLHVRIKNAVYTYLASCDNIHSLPTKATRCYYHTKIMTPYSMIRKYAKHTWYLHNQNHAKYLRTRRCDSPAITPRCPNLGLKLLFLSVSF
jgi:hypothetical protein